MIFYIIITLNIVQSMKIKNKHFSFFFMNCIIEYIERKVRKVTFAGAYRNEYIERKVRKVTFAGAYRNLKLMVLANIIKDYTLTKDSGVANA